MNVKLAKFVEVKNVKNFRPLPPHVCHSVLFSHTPSPNIRVYFQDPPFQ